MDTDTNELPRLSARSKRIVVFGPVTREDEYMFAAAMFEYHCVRSERLSDRFVFDAWDEQTCQ